MTATSFLPPDKPWRAAAWTPTPAGAVDPKHTGFPDAHRATVWARKQRQHGKRALVWHLSTLPPAEVIRVFPELEAAGLS